MSQQRKIAYRLLALLALVAMLGLGACKKKESVAPAEKAKGEPAAKTEPAKAGEAAQAAAKAAPAKAGEAAQAAAKAAPAKAADAARAAAKKVAAAAPAAPVQAVAKDVIGWGSIASFDALIKLVQDVATKVSPTPVPVEMALEGLRGMLGFKTMDWFDKAKPIRVVILNPKLFPNVGLMVLPITGADKLKATLPDAKKENDQGNQFSFSLRSQTLYVNVLGNNVVLAVGPKMFAAAKPFIEKNFGNHTPTVPVEMTLAMDNVVTIFGEEINKAEAGVVHEMARSLAGMPFPGMGPLMEKEYKLIFDGIRQIQRIDMAFQATGGSVQLPVTLTVKGGEGFAKGIAGMLGRNLQLVDLLPATSYLVMGINYDPASLSVWYELGRKFIEDGLKLSAEERTTFGKLFSESIALQTGDGAFSFSRQGAFSFAMDAIYGSTDGMKMRSNTLAIYGMLFNKLIAMAKEVTKKEGGEIPAQFDLSSFPKAVQSLSVLIAPFGVTLALASEDYKGGKIDYLDIKVDYTKLPPIEPSVKNIITAMVGDHLQFAMGFGPKLMQIAVGPQGVARIKATLDGAKPLSGDPSFASAHKGILAGDGGLFFIDPVKALKAFTAIPDLAPLKSKIDAMGAMGGLALQMKAVAANQLRITLSVPLEPIAKIVGIFM